MVYSHPHMHGMKKEDNSLHLELVKVAKSLNDTGLNRGTSGNCSVRYKSGFLVTPSGVPTKNLIVNNIVEMDLQGKVITGSKPSSEWRFHRDIIQNRADVGAVIHTHSTFATAVSCLNLDVPPFHYMIAVAGGDNIKCAPYALFGSQELSDVALEALQNRKVCLLSNHGMIAVGSNLEDAFAVAVEVENLCQQYLLTLQAGKPKLLSEAEMVEVRKQFQGYGNWSNDIVKSD